MFRTYEPARDRLVAVKAFRLDLTPEQARALADELQGIADAGLDHPSIVRPIAAGVEATIAFAASEYVAAESLDIALRHYAPAPLDKVLPFITQLAGAVDFARAAGTGHGALHPRDIFVTPDEARATGFGVVQALERLGVRAPVRRPYTAPERVDGGSWDVSADVYSLGAIAFELLTARRPVGADAGELGSTAGPYGEAVGHVISRALADAPAGRYPSALAFAAALEAASRGERTTGAIAEVQAVAGQTAAPAEAPSPNEPAADARALVIEPDIDVEREADEAEIQLRADEASARRAADAEAEPRPEPPSQPQPPLESGLEPAPEPALDLAAAPGAEPPEPSLFDLDRDTGDVIPEVQHPGFPPEPDRAAQRFDTYAPPPRGYESEAARRPRPVFLPVALTLLLGLFVGFLAGYLVGSRDTAGTSPAGSPVAPEKTATEARRQARPPRATGGPGTSAPQVRRGTSVTASRGEPERSAPRAARPVAQAPAAEPAPARGRLMVRSTPAGAQVFVNGRRRGTTPLAMRDLAPGAYTIRVARSGFDEQSRRVTVSSAGVRELNLRLERSRPAAPVSFTGSLYVDSRPRGARVFLDGKEIGTTPMQAGDIRSGAHVVRLELKDHRTWTASTRVVAGEVARVTGSLERQR